MNRVLPRRIAALVAVSCCAEVVTADRVDGTPVPRFSDATQSSGLDFLHSNGATGEKNYYEVMGSGICLFDADGDKRLDVYFVNSAGRCKLFENRGGLRFQDVTARSGLGDVGYGMGAVSADVENDGDADLLVTTFGVERFFLNQGGEFREAASSCGIGDSRWSCGATFFDADRDGRLDLYVVNYVDVARPDTARCFAEGGRLRLYCPPRRYPRTESTFYRNLGSARFEDATRAAGLGGFAARGLGVVAFDYDRKNGPDILVANDLDPNWLFRNRGDGTFDEIAMTAGVSHSETGAALSGMGIAIADYDNDGWLDVFITNYVNEPNSLFRNDGAGHFFDVSAPSGLGPTSLAGVGWGTEFFDYDLDGWDDVLVANGHTESDAERTDPTTTYRQRGYLYHNRGDGRFEEVAARDAPALMTPRAGRGAAFGDLDDDGDVDVVISNQNAKALLLENLGGGGNHWIGVRAIGGKSNRDAVGTRVEVFSGPLHRTREVQAGGSYLSCHDRRVLLGLGRRDVVDSLVVSWPSGLRETHRNLGVDRYHTITEGKP